MPPVTRSGRGRGRPPLWRRSSPEPASARRVPSPAPVSAADTQAGFLREMRAEQQVVLEEFRAEQARSRTEHARARAEFESTLTRAIDTMREMTAVITRLEKRSVEVETPAGTSDPHSVPQPPLLPQPHLVSHTVSQSHSVSHTIPSPHPVSHTVSRPHSVSPLPQSPLVFADIFERPVPFPFPLTGSCESPVSTTPAVPHHPSTERDQSETTRPIHFPPGESLRGPVYHPSERVVRQRRVRTRGQDQQQSFPSQRQRTETGTVESQTSRFVPQTQTTHHHLGQPKRQTIVQQQRPPYQAEGYQLYPICSYCQRRHLGECRRLTGTCFLCGGADHWATMCPLGVQQQQPQSQSPQPQQPQYPRPVPQQPRARFAPYQRPYPPVPPTQSAGPTGVTTVFVEEILDVEPLAVDRSSVVQR